MKKLLILLVMVLSAGSMHAQQNVFTHKVKRGDTLYNISQAYGVTVDAIKKQNPGLTDNIMLGQTIDIPQSLSGEIKHTIQAGETLYAISRKYNVTSKSITDANPGLSASNFQTGTVIVVPFGVRATAAQQSEDIASPKERTGCKLTHVVAKKETVYSICKQYGVTEKELYKANPELKDAKLKKGASLCIPYSGDEKYVQATDSEIFKALDEQKSVRFSTIKVAVILPFGLDNTKRTSEAAKMADFYRGFLLAVDSIKDSGADIEVFAYDEKGTDAESVKSILSEPEMKNMNLIVGPMRSEHVIPVTQYAHENNIINVLPASTRENAVNSHKTSFQVNSPQSYTNSFVFDKFYEQNADANVVFVAMNDKGDYADYVWSFKKYLEQKGKAYSRIGFVELENLPKMLKKGVRNILIPSSGSTQAFENLTNELNNLNVTESYNVSLFGYPDWQTLGEVNLANLEKYKCSYFTTFFCDASLQRVASFDYRFKRWFGKAQLSSCPKYGALGYDIAAFFIGGMNVYGGSFVTNQDKVTYTSLQNPFHFVRKNNWSGFENTVMMFVTYKGDDTMEIKRYE